jgi:3-dehydroquinate synthase
MKPIKIKLNKKIRNPYSIFIERNSYGQILRFLKKEFPQSVCVIITDETVKKLYGEKLRALLKKDGRKVFLFSIPDGELSKNQKNKTILEEKMLKLRIDRQAVIISLGGGVVGDLAGFIAATYMRGIPYIQVPTTLLAMVDSSIGGKTGIDTPQGKNLIGAFWPPRAIFIDLKCIRSLSQKQFINGLVEALKMFITSDLKSFDYLEKNINKLLNREAQAVKNVVKSAIRIKAGIVERDEREDGERMILNFGHTIGHTLEKLSQYKMLHGYAVALGIIIESSLSVDASKLREQDYLRIKNLLVGKMRIDLKQLRAYSAKEILNCAKNDKKTKNGKLRYVLLKKIGEVHNKKNIFARHIEDTAVVRVLNKIKLADNI